MLSKPHSFTSAAQSRVPQSNGKDDVGDDVDDDLNEPPAHVKSVRDGLLDFNHFLGLQAVMLVLGDDDAGKDDEDGIPLSAYKPDGMTRSQREREREFVESAHALVKGAQIIECGHHKDKWQRLFQSVLTERMDIAGESKYVHRPRDSNSG